jgi:hypothetical protein
MSKVCYTYGEMITWEDRAAAVAWWIAALFLGPISILGFFAGGWFILTVLWAFALDLTTLNPFKRSTDASRVVPQGEPRPEPRVVQSQVAGYRPRSPRPQQAPQSYDADRQVTEELPILLEHQDHRTTPDTTLDSEKQSREGTSGPGSEQLQFPQTTRPPAPSGTGEESDLGR